MRYLIILFVMFSANAFAVDFELSGGINKYKRAQNGTWYQEAFPYELDLKTATWGFGVSHKFNGMPRLRLEYVHLGQASADAYAVPSDYNYIHNTNTCNVKCLPLAHFQSKGDVQGVALTVAPEFRFKHVSLFVEVGIYVFRPRYWAVVNDIMYGSPEGDLTGVEFVKEFTIRHDSNIQSSWVIGAGVRYKNVDFLFRIYDVGANDDDVPAVYRGASTATLRVHF